MKQFLIFSFRLTYVWLETFAYLAILFGPIIWGLYGFGILK
jgi:hypothetical protein